METIIRKVVLLGDQGVGKTSTIIRYVRNSFNQTMSPTIGAAFFSSKILIKEVNVKLKIWDTAGQERYRAVAPIFYRNADAALIMYDITSRKSFEGMINWVVELKKNVATPMVLCIVGNKLDLEQQRTVSQDEASHYAVTVGAAYHECSALKGQGVVTVFEDIAHGLLLLYKTSVNRNCFKIGNIVDIMVNRSESEVTDGRKKRLPHAGVFKKRCC